MDALVVAFGLGVGLMCQPRHEHRAHGHSSCYQQQYGADGQEQHIVELVAVDGMQAFEHHDPGDGPWKGADGQPRGEWDIDGPGTQVPPPSEGLGDCHVDQVRADGHDRRGADHKHEQRRQRPPADASEPNQGVSGNERC